MNMRGDYSNSFAQTFSEFLKKFGVSCYQISRYTHLDEGYLSRLKNGEKNIPSRETVLKIGLAFVHYSDKVTLSDIEILFRSTSLSTISRRSQYDFI
jgi:hypothetical protein